MYRQLDEDHLVDDVAELLGKAEEMRALVAAVSASDIEDSEFVA